MSTHAIPSVRESWHDGLTAMHWRVLNCSFLGWIFDGYETFALIVVLLPAMHSVLLPAQLATPALYAGTVIGITLLGWGIGGVGGGILADYVGRKRMMLWSVFLYALFAGFTALAQNFVQLCALRFLTGLAMGSEWSTGISLLAETWPDRARPKGAGFLQSGFGWGTLLAALTWTLLSGFDPLGADTWRLMFVVGAIPALFVLYIRRRIDESEQWRRAVLEKRWSATTADTGAAAGTQRRPFTLVQLFAEPEARRRTLLALALSVVTTVGWWAISSWLPTHAIALAKAEGVAAPAVWGSRVSIAYTSGAIAAYLASGFLADWLGRRRFIFFTFLGALVTTYLTYGLAHSVMELMLIAPINGFFTLGCAYAWMAIYPAELFTPTVRSTAVSFIFNAARLIAWIFPIISGSMISTFGGVPHAAMTLGSVYLFGMILPWFMPETKGRPLP
jgi:MFS family permease